MQKGYDVKSVQASCQGQSAGRQVIIALSVVSPSLLVRFSAYLVVEGLDGGGLAGRERAGVRGNCQRQHGNYKSCQHFL